MKVSTSIIEHCTQVLEILAKHGRGMRLTDISNALGIPKSGVHRMLNALAKLGWIEQDEKLGLYQLTLRLTTLGQRFLMASGIPDLCQPVITYLAQETRELVRLAVVHGDGLTWISHAQGSNAGLIYSPRMIADVPLHATATGKIWLASLRTEDAVRIVLKRGFGQPGEFGPAAITSVEQLIRELEETRNRGWGLAREEAEPGVLAMAAAIKREGGTVVGTVSVAGPVLRMREERLAPLSTLMLATAKDLEALWPLRSLRQEEDKPELKHLSARS
jgi:DNA-binding IclR family transcriptional regulator